MALWGAVIGQLFFGVFADFVGRRRIFIITLVLITVGALGSAASVDTPAFSVYQQLAIWRFILGVGVGGEYPLSAAITSETATARTRGRLVCPRTRSRADGAGCPGLTNLQGASQRARIVPSWRRCSRCKAWARCCRRW